MKDKQDMAFRDKVISKWIKAQRGQSGWLHLPILLSMVAYSASAQASENGELVIQGHLTEPGKALDKVIVLQGDQVVQAKELHVGAENFHLELARQGLQVDQPLLIKVVAADGTEFTYLLQSVPASAAVEISYSSTLHHALIEAGQLAADTTYQQFLTLVTDGGPYADLMAAAKTVIDYDLPEIASDSVFDIYGHFLAQNESYLTSFREQYLVEFNSSREQLASNGWGAGATAGEAAGAAESFSLGQVLAGGAGAVAVGAGGGGGGGGSTGGGSTGGGTETGGGSTGSSGGDSGGSTGGGTDTGGGTGSSSISGVVSDGYIKGATVFLDKDGDRELDANEAWTTTDQYGRFTLEEGEGDLVSLGGVDTSTNKAVTQVYVAPSGATQLNPFTTLVVEMMGQDRSQQSQEQALAKVASIFGLEDVDILSTDLLGEAVDETSGVVNDKLVKAQVAAVSVATVVEQLTQTLVKSYDGSLTEAQIKQVSLVAYEVVTEALLNDTITLQASTDTAGAFSVLFVTAAERVQQALTAEGTAYQIAEFDPNFGTSVNNASSHVGNLIGETLSNFSEITDFSHTGALENAVASQALALDVLDRINKDLTLEQAGSTYKDADLETYKALLGNVSGIAPETGADSITVTYGSDPITIDVLANDKIGGDQGSLRLAAGNDSPYNVSPDGLSLNYALPTELNTLLVGESKEVSFTYTVEQVINDSVVGRSFETVTLTVEGTYTRPAATTPVVEPVSEKGSLASLDLLADAAEGLTVLIQAPLPKGSYTLEEGVLSYSPGSAFAKLAAGETGSDSLTYVLQDANGVQSLPVTLTFAISGENDAPVLQDVAVQGIEDLAISGQLFASDVDDAASTLSFAPVGGEAVEGSDAMALAIADKGVFTLSPSGAYTFTPVADFAGSVAVPYSVTDAAGTSVEASLTLTFKAVNDAPVADAPPAFNIEEGGQVEGTLSATDSDGDALTFEAVGTPVGGTLTLQADGTFTFIPEEGFTGQASFRYLANDGANLSEPQAVLINVAAVNDAPAPEDLSLTIAEGELVQGQLASGDADSDPANITFNQVGDAVNGTLALNSADGSFTFTPAANFFGTASFQYSVSDGEFTSETRSVTIDVTPLATTPELTVSHEVLSPTEIALNISAEAVNPAAGETVLVRIANLPQGSVLSAGTLDNGSYLLDQSELADLVLTTASAADVLALQVSAYAVLDGASSTPATETVSEAVRKLADTPTVTVSAEPVAEDNALSLSIQVTSGEAEPAASEETFEIILSGIPAGYLLSAEAGPVTVTEGTATFSHTDLVDGSIPGLTVTAPANLAETIDLTLTVRTTEPSSHHSVEASQSLTLSYTPVVDGVDTIDVAQGSDLNVDEGSTVALDISAELLDGDGSESLVFQLSGVPAGMTLNAGVLLSTVEGTSTYLLSAEEAQALQLTLPENPSAATETYTLTATAVVTEELSGESINATSRAITLNIEPVADDPVVSVQAVEAQAGQAVALAIDVSISANDSLTVELSGYPAGTAFSAGNEAAGTLTLTAEELAGLTMTLPEAADDFSLNVAAYTTSGSDQSDIVAAPLAVDVLHAPGLPEVSVTPSETDNSFVIAATEGAHTDDLDIVITGLPVDAYVIDSNGATVGAGGAGIWVLDESELDGAGMTVISPSNTSLSADIQVTVTAKNSDSGLSSAADTVAATVATVASVDPLVLDLNGDGQYDLTSVVDSTVAFDMDLDGDGDSTAWVGAQDGLLVHDLNSNGQIDDVSELFSERYAGGEHASGSAALATLDSNGDGLINDADTAFNDLQVWVDANQDGRVDAGELSSLAARNISEIGLDTQVSGGAVNGNTLVGEGSFVIDGESRSYADVALNYYPQGNAATNSSAPVVSLTTPQITAAEGSGPIELGLDISISDGTIPFVLISGVTGGALAGPVQQVPGTSDQYMVYGPEAANLSSVSFIPAADFSGELALSVASMAYVPGSGMQFGPMTTLVVEVFAAPELSLTDVQVAEDQTVTLPLALSYEDSAAQVLDQLTIAGVPEGASLAIGESAVALSDGTALIEGELLAALRAGDALTITPAANSAADFELQLTARVSDLDSDAVATSSATARVQVNAVADAPELTLDSDSIEIRPGETIDLGAALALSDVDGSEYATILVSGLPAGATLTKGVPLFGTYYLTPAQLADAALKLNGTADDFELTITAISTEKENGDSAQVIRTIAVDVTNPLQAPSLALTAASQADEDSLITLNIELSQPQAGETIVVNLSGLPEGAQLLVAGNAVTANEGVYSLSTEQLQDLALQPPQNFSGVMQLKAEAVALLGEQQARSGDSLAIKVIPVADAPDLAELPAELQVQEGIWNDLPLSTSQIALADTDGSEQAFLRIAGLPDGVRLSAGKVLSDGSVIIKAADLDGLQLAVSPADLESASFALTVSALSKETLNGHTATSAEQTLNVSVNLSADKPSLTVTAPDAAVEDQPITFSVMAAGGLGETVTVLVKNLPAGASLSKGVPEGDGVYRLADSDLGELTLTLKPGQYGQLNLAVEAYTEVGGSRSESVSSKLAIKVLPEFDSAQVNAPGVVTAVEGQLTPFEIELTMPEGSTELVRLQIDNIPEGLQFITANGWHLNVTDGSYSGAYTSAAAVQRLLEGLQIIAPEIDLSRVELPPLQVTLTTREDGTSGNEVSSSVAVQVVVNDQYSTVPGIQVNAVTGDEDSPIALDIQILSTLPSEQLAVVITNLPDGVELSAGTPESDGIHLTIDQLEGLSLLAPTDFNGVIRADVRVDATLASGEVVSAADALKVTVTPVNDAPQAQALTFETGEDMVISDRLLGSDVETENGKLQFRIVEGSVKHGSLELAEDGSFDFTPAANFSGVAQFKYLASDGELDSEPQLVRIKVTPANDAPLANDDSATVAEDLDTGINIRVLANDKDVDAFDLPRLSADYLEYDAGQGGSLSLTDDGLKLHFNPLQDFQHLAAGETATVTGRYKAVDEQGVPSEDWATVTITVTGSNDLPTVTGVALDAVEDGSPVTIALLGADPDTSDSLSYQLLSELDAGQGTAVINTDGTLTFTPGSDFQSLAAGETLELSVDYKAVDTHGGASEQSAPVTIRVTGVNDAPVVEEMSVFLEASAAERFTFAGSDVDASDTLSYTIVDSDVGDGILTNNGDGTFSYDPNGAYDHLAGGQPVDLSFQYFATDSQGAESETRTVSLRIVGENTPPSANAIELEITENGIYEGQLQGEDGDMGAQLSYALVEGPASVTVNPDGTFSFNPGVEFDDLALGQVREVTFSYQVTDEFNATSAPAVVTLQVQGSNDAPQAEALFASANEDSSAITAAFVAADADNGAQLSFEIVEGIGSEQGLLTNNGDGSFSYDPNGMFETLAVGETASVTFSYRALDEHGAASAPATVTLTISGGNDAPLVSALSITASEDGATVGGSLIGSDVDNNAVLSYALVEGPAEGALILNADGSFEYDPGTGFQDLAEGESREVSFSYRASDEHGAQSEAAQVTVRVDGVNDAPVAAAVAAAAVEDGTAITVDFAGSDIDGDTDLVYSLTSGLSAGQGELVNNQDGTFTFNPGSDFQALAAGEQAEVTFAYSVTDQAGAGLTSEAAQVTLTISGSNDAPQASDLAATVRPDGDGLLTVTGQLKGQDIDGDVLSFELVSDVQTGSLSLDPETGAFSYSFDPKAGDFSEVGFSYRVFDGTAYSEPAQVQLLGNTIIADGLEPKEVRGSEVDEHIYLIDSGYTVNAGSGNDLIAMLSAEYSEAQHALLGGSGQDDYLLVAQKDQALHVNAVIADYDAAEGDRIDFSQLRDSSGGLLNLDDILANVQAEGSDLIFSLDNFRTAEDQAVSGELVVIGGNMNEMQFVFDPAASALNQLDALDPLQDYIS